jgi:DNA-binding ferritin-like protein
MEKGCPGKDKGCGGGGAGCGAQKGGCDACEKADACPCSGKGKGNAKGAVLDMMKAVPPPPPADGGPGGSLKETHASGKGPFIGPRGGKWADPEHKIPFKEDVPDYKLQVHGMTLEQAKDVATRMHAGIGQAADLCKINPSMCHDNLGIERSDMPQIPNDVQDKFLDHLKGNGVKVETLDVKPGQLKATQKEINATKVLGMAQAVKDGKLNLHDRAIVVSADNYVLDGHHRWGALVLSDPGHTMPIIRVGLPIRQLLKQSLEFPGITTGQGFAAPSAKSLGDLVVDFMCKSTSSDVGVAALRTLLSALQAMRECYHVLHWQASGQSSYGDHLMYGRLYDTLVEEVDATAEKLVGVSGFPDAVQASQLAAETAEKVAAMGVSPVGMLAVERGLTETTIPATRAVLLAQGELSTGLDNFLGGVADAHETHVYLLTLRTAGDGGMSKSERPNSVGLELWGDAADRDVRNHVATAPAGMSADSMDDLVKEYGQDSVDEALDQASDQAGGREVRKADGGGGLFTARVGGTGAGPGSRGGHVIGKTKSGKPIYRRAQTPDVHRVQTVDYTHEDHAAAAREHMKAALSSPEGTHAKAYHETMADHHDAAAESHGADAAYRPTLERVKGHTAKVGAWHAQRMLAGHTHVQKSLDDYPHDAELEKAWSEWRVSRRDRLEKALFKSGGPYIGPRGGKWADARHTIAWQEGKHDNPTSLVPFQGRTDTDAAEDDDARQHAFTRNRVANAMRDVEQAHELARDAKTADDHRNAANWYTAAATDIYRAVIDRRKPGPGSTAVDYYARPTLYEATSPEVQHASYLHNLLTTQAEEQLRQFESKRDEEEAAQAATDTARAGRMAEAAAYEGGRVATVREARARTGKPQPATIQVALSGGTVGTEDASHKVGLYAVHTRKTADGKQHVVTHLPTGQAVQRLTGGVTTAHRLANHLAEHAPVGAELALHDMPTQAHRDVMKAALASFPATTRKKKAS